MEAKIYNSTGNESGKVKLPDSVFAVAWNADLVHQVVMAQQANARTPVAHTKDRSEVRGGGRKPWRQKGTGRARHGSRRSPIWRGGGVTHGPRNEKEYGRKVTKKMRTKALYSVLSRKLKDGEILFVDQLSFVEPKAKEAKVALASLARVQGFENLTTKRHNAGLIALASDDKLVKKSFANFGNVEVEEVRNLNPVDLLTYKYLVIVGPEDAITLLESKTK